MNYRGEWFVMFKHRVPANMLFPGKDKEFIIQEMEKLAPYEIGEAIAQVKFNRVETTIWEEYDELSDTSRGTDGGLIRE